MPTYTVREWEHLQYGDNEGQITRHHADQLAAIAASSTFAGRGGSGVLEHGRKALRARGVVGILATGHSSLEILPKIDTPPDTTSDLQNAAVRKRLINMLAVALDLKIDLGTITELDWQRETLLEILIRVFCEKLTTALRKGMPRRYLNNNDDLPLLRGKLDVTRQFTRHAVNPSRLACSFDVLSEDIALNQIVKAAASRLMRLSRRSENQKRLREIAFVYADIKDVAVDALRWDQVVIDRTNTAWQEIFAMSELFLRNKYQTTTGGSGRGTALLFEMNALFEEYVGRLMSRALAGTGFSVSLQGGREYCLTDTGDGRRLFQTRPDILIRRSGVVTHVIDTKWKRISPRIDDPKLGVSQSDVYQMMAYAQLYHAQRLTLLYPHHSALRTAEGIHARHQISGNTAILEMASIDVSTSTEIVSRLRKLVLDGSLVGDQQPTKEAAA